MVYARRICWVMLYVLLFLFVCSVDFQITDTTLDPSWRNAYNYFAKSDFSFGTEIVFTYGPLSWLTLRAFDAELFWGKTSFWLVMAAVSVVMLGLFRRASGTLAAGLVFLGLVLTLSLDSFFISTVVLAYTLLIMYSQSDNRFYIPLLFGVCGIFGVLALTKFTLFVTVGIAIVLLSCYYCFKRQFIHLLAIAGFYSLTLFALWTVAADQAPHHLFIYIINALEVSRGYTAMSRYGDPASILAVVLCLTLLGLVTPKTPFISWRKHIGTLFIYGYILIITFLVWKLGFIRHNVREPMFFAFIAVVSGVVLGAARLSFKETLQLERERWEKLFKVKTESGKELVLVLTSPWFFKGGLIIVLCVAFFMFGSIKYRDHFPQAFLSEKIYELKRNAGRLLIPGSMQALKSDLENQQAATISQYRLDKIKSIVGNETVDVYGFNQNYAIFNGLNWTPRPIFQSYSAYTSKLLKANEAAIIENGPAFVLLQIQTIDGRFPTADDSLWLTQLLHRYSIVDEESPFLLFQKREERETPELALVHEGEVGWGVPYHLKPSEQLSYISLDINENVLGKARSALFKPPLVFIEVTLEDGMNKVFRIIPAMVGELFLLSPLVENNDDLLSALSGLSQKHVTQLKLSTTNPAYFQSGIHLKLYSESLIEGAFNPWEFALKGISNRTPVDAVLEHPLEKRIWGNEQAVLFHPNGQLLFNLEPTDHSVSVEVGLLPEVKAAGKSDGVTFYLESFDPNNQAWTTLNRIFIDPSDDRLSRQLQANQLQRLGSERLRLRVDAGANNDSTYDWAVIRDIVFH
ncbi:hypothetical protein [Paenibacillus sp. KS-LC4]|uniref:hypothetical protein n=1 Tax=Paenibacillus sp. KS-LC4 TaxID=2979727 RepID=UPI0030D00DE7